MVIDVDVPEMGESVSEVTILEWLKPDGAHVEKDDPLCVLETDKANVDLPAPAAGTLTQLRKVDDTLEVGDLLARIDPAGAPSTAAADASRPAATASPAGAEAAPAPLAADGPPSSPPAPAGEVSQGAVVQAPGAAPAPGVADAPAPDPPARIDLDRLSPAVRRLVEEHHLDPSRIVGTGRGGRLIKQDILAYLKERERDARERSAAEVPASAPAPSSAPSQLPAPSPAEPAGATADSPAAAGSSPGPDEPVRPPGAEGSPPVPAAAPATGGQAPPAAASQTAGERRGQRREPMSRLRRRVASRLVEAQRTAAMLTTFNEIDLSEVMALRRRHKQAFQDKYGLSLGLMSFFSRAVIITLGELPAVNASIEGEDVVYHDYVHLGIAVSTDRGLLVPVLRHADTLSMAQIEGEIKRLAQATRDNKLSLDELSGGTFTITNGGVFGSMMSTPILTPPQTGILGMHAIKDRPVAVAGEVVIRPMMYTALTYDHRLVDGQQSVRFLVRLKELLEDPARLMLEV